MFAGLVETVGVIRSIVRRGEDRLGVVVSSPFEDTQVGDSISVSGVCVTVTDVGRAEFGFFVSSETFQRSKFGALPVGARVNLERALRLGDRLGGHIVQGHVDEVGRVASFEKKGGEAVLSVEHSGRWDQLVVEKGSVCVDGVSLTVAECGSGSFSVAMIPHTLERTSLGGLNVGEQLNLEFDVLAKYVLKCLQSYLPEDIGGSLKGKMTVEFLREHGFI